MSAIRAISSLRILCSHLAHSIRLLDTQQLMAAGILDWKTICEFAGPRIPMIFVDHEFHVWFRSNRGRQVIEAKFNGSIPPAFFSFQTF